MPHILISIPPVACSNSLFSVTKQYKVALSVMQKPGPALQCLTTARVSGKPTMSHVSILGGHACYQASHEINAEGCSLIVLVSQDLKFPSSTLHVSQLSLHLRSSLGNCDHHLARAAQDFPSHSLTYAAGLHCCFCDHHPEGAAQDRLN